MADRLVMYYDVESSFSYLAFEVLQRSCTLIVTDWNSLCLAQIADCVTASNPPAITCLPVWSAVSGAHPGPPPAIWLRSSANGATVHTGINPHGTSQSTCGLLCLARYSRLQAMHLQQLAAPRKVCTCLRSALCCTSPRLRT